MGLRQLLEILERIDELMMSYTKMLVKVREDVDSIIATLDRLQKEKQTTRKRGKATVNHDLFSINTEQLRTLDAATIEQLRLAQQHHQMWQQQNCTFSNNMTTAALHFDYMGFYVEGSCEVLHERA